MMMMRSRCSGIAKGKRVAPKTKPLAASRWRGFEDKSLTMTYFHKRMFTIIGAKAFHCPVRDGKEWDHLAMVVRRKGLGGQACEPARPNQEEAQRVARVSHPGWGGDRRATRVMFDESCVRHTRCVCSVLNGTCRYALISGLV